MKIEEMANKIQKKGGKIYLVGGMVRDTLMEKESKDEDYCITGIDQYDFLEMFPNAIRKGKSFEVFALGEKEFALARKEIKQGKGHKGFQIITGKEIRIEEDLARRDLTINAIAQDVLTKEIIDPFEGRKDLKNKKIKAISQAFSEDPLRIYRAARFASCLEFEVTEDTIEKMKQCKEELDTLPKERVIEEFKKALKSSKPSIFFEVLKKAEIFEIHFPEIYRLVGSLQPEKFHPEGDSFCHTMLVLDLCAEKTTELAVRYAALVHDLGKGMTRKEDYPHHYGHDKKGVFAVESLSKRLGVPKIWESYGKTSAKEHMLGGIFGKMSPKKQVDFIERVNHTSLGLENLQLIVDCDRQGRGGYISTQQEKWQSEFLAIAQQCLTEISGESIHKTGFLQKGKNFGKKLHEERILWIKQHSKSFVKEKIKFIKK